MSLHHTQRHFSTREALSLKDRSVESQRGSALTSTQGTVGKAHSTQTTAHPKRTRGRQVQPYARTGRHARCSRATPQTTINLLKIGQAWRSNECDGARKHKPQTVYKIMKGAVERKQTPKAIGREACREIYPWVRCYKYLELSCRNLVVGAATPLLPVKARNGSARTNESGQSNTKNGKRVGHPGAAPASLSIGVWRWAGP